MFMYVFSHFLHSVISHAHVFSVPVFTAFPPSHIHFLFVVMDILTIVSLISR